MPQISHVEKHFTSSEAVRDIVIGMSDVLRSYGVEDDQVVPVVR